MLSRIRLGFRAGIAAFNSSATAASEPEHPLVSPPRQFIRSTAAAWSIAFGGTGLGIWLTLQEAEIREATALFFHYVWRRELAPLAPWQLVFWLACLVWATLLYRRLKADDSAGTERTLGLLRAIHKVPNLRVVKDYRKRYFDPTITALGQLVPKTPPATPEEAAGRIQEALTIIAHLARDFASVPDASYGANVMLVAGPKNFDDLRSSLRFVQDVRDTASLKAILYLPEALLIRSVGKGDRNFPLIALPVPETIKTSDGYLLALPGAPSALLGNPSVYEDTRLMEKECGDFPREIVDEIRHYFAEDGAGASVRSFASFRLGTEENPLGVLNVDSNLPCVLGESEEYYITFVALLEPLLAALAVQVREYAKLAGPPKGAAV